MSDHSEVLAKAHEELRAERLARPLRTFRIINGSGFTEEVRAASWELSHGSLIFRANDGAAFRAIAPGGWAEVRDAE